MAEHTDTKRPVLTRLTQRDDAAVRAIAAREAETVSTILRRLIRRGLATEVRNGDESA